MDTQYNADEALAGCKAKVKLRGKEYTVVDLPVRVRIAKELEYNAIEARMTELAATVTQDTVDEFNEVYNQYQRMTVDLALEGVSDAVALDLTEREMQLVADAYKHWRDSKIPAEAMLGKDEPADGSLPDQP